MMQIDEEPNKLDDWKETMIREVEFSFPTVADTFNVGRQFHEIVVHVVFCHTCIEILL